jgi:N4-(beta-N-acetylglucosaminyl)-L-asparaginase
LIAIASHNGLQAAQLAYGLLTQGRAPLDAVVEGVTVIEDDPEELTVGYGGLPNEEGVVELDAAVMDGKTHRGGAVAAMRDIRHAAKVARLVMLQTRRVMLAGEGARQFAVANGFKPEDLLTEKTRRMWLRWRQSRDPNGDWLPPEASPESDSNEYFAKQFYKKGGTVHCSAMDANGDLACATTTSGHAYKLAGRVGDSPILGAGLYVDNDLGSCGSIGHGELNMEHLSSFAAVDLLRGGVSLVDAGLEILRRIGRKCGDARRDEQGRPKFNLQLYLLGKDGQHAGVALWGPKQYAVCDADGPRLMDCVAMYERS